MRTTWLGGLLVLGVTCLAAAGCAQTPADDVSAAMQGELATAVQEGCQTEISTFCSKVTPGEGRVLACLFAFEDQLSGQCEYALYNSAARLERAIDAVSYVATECEADIDAHCANVEIGEGRIASCLKARGDQLAPACSKALTDVGVK